MSTISPYVGDGANREFDITFNYRRASTVHVKVDGIDVPFNFVSSSRVVVDEAPASGAEVIVYRKTDVSEAEEQFTDGMILNGPDLNDAIGQARERAEELGFSIEQEVPRALRGPTSEDALRNLPKAAERANKFLMFDDEGQPGVLTPEDLAAPAQAALGETRLVADQVNVSREAIAAAENVYQTKALGEAATVQGDFFLYRSGNTIVFAERLASGSQVFDTMNAKSLSAWSFGAIGNGTGDNGPILTTAIARAVALGVPLEFGPGTYRIQNPIVPPAGSRVHLHFAEGVTLVGANIDYTEMFKGEGYSIKIEGAPLLRNFKRAFRLLSSPATAYKGLVWDLGATRFEDWSSQAVFIDAGQHADSYIEKFVLDGAYFSARATQTTKYPYDVLQSEQSYPIRHISIRNVIARNGGREGFRFDHASNVFMRVEGVDMREYVTNLTSSDPDAHFIFNSSGHQKIVDSVFIGLRPKDSTTNMDDAEGIGRGGAFLEMSNVYLEDAGSGEAVLGLKCRKASLKNVTIVTTQAHRDACAATSGSRKDVSAILAPYDELRMDNVVVEGGTGAALDFQGNTNKTIVTGSIEVRDWRSLRRTVAGGAYVYSSLYSSGSAIRVAGNNHHIDLTVNCVGPTFPRRVFNMIGGSLATCILRGFHKTAERPANAPGEESVDNTADLGTTVYRFEGAVSDLRLLGTVDAKDAERVFSASAAFTSPKVEVSAEVRNPDPVKWEELVGQPFTEKITGDLRMDLRLRYSAAQAISQQRVMQLRVPNGATLSVDVKGTIVSPSFPRGARIAQSLLVSASGGVASTIVPKTSTVDQLGSDYIAATTEVGPFSTNAVHLYVARTTGDVPCKPACDIKVELSAAT
ncbi:phage tail fiber protein [Alteriqipengyuania flavescens]|uniref:phage tail fiber domain-containing protein n=1 Tax=Alteriqipengyuania flavescens TaxID=3053610 RepID=UPI0025B5159B|nr:phage tail fiber protein [Alteriqipengyuania flavescens]WJY17679.1 phage tail fiber protein [Alteriqipengyuania flavescens]WJY23622.1 phage tail fiber protein [Alteriqipengyuania flavescens]